MFILAAALIVAGVALFVAAPLGNGLLGARAKTAGELDADRNRHQHELAMQGLNELEFDREMGKLSDADYAAMRTALEDRALTAMAALDKSARDKTQAAEPPKPRLAAAPKRPAQIAPVTLPPAPSRTIERAQIPLRGEAASRKFRFCPQCGMRAAPEANFCAECGLAFRPVARLTNRTD
ncbi:MAG TPA: c-type cytochrome biogenesis protein CcmI [Candidatus Acidoferrales bacterium]|nr:c-type cytochrome biogenesis protein CcmI [Candidatus Acidoferrales bacterium]